MCHVNKFSFYSDCLFVGVSVCVCVCGIQSLAVVKQRTRRWLQPTAVRGTQPSVSTTVLAFAKMSCLRCTFN